jgi:hypothetical protein
MSMIGAGRSRHRFISKLALTVAAGLLAACGQQVSPAPVKLTGGTLCYADYQKCVSPVFDAVIHAQSGNATCSAGGCHSEYTGSGGAFKIYPNPAANSSEMLANFYTVTNNGFVNLDNPDESKLLLKPSAMGRSVFAHSGGNIFPNANDACYVAIRSWIANRVSDSNDPACGACTPPTISNCGY